MICGESKQGKIPFSGHFTKKHPELDEEDKILLLCNEYYGEINVNNTIKDYIDEKICSHDIRKNKFDKVVDLLKLRGLLRTHSEEKLTKRYTEKYKSTLKEKYNTDNVSKLDWVKDKKVKTYTEQYGSYENYKKIRAIQMAKGFDEYINDKERLQRTYEKHLETIKCKYNVDNIAHIPHVREKMSKSKKKFFSNMSYDERLEYTLKARDAVCSRGGYESSLEIRVQKILVDNEINFIKHVSLFKYNYDILLFGDVILEIQGDMWHGNPQFYNHDDLIMAKLLVSDIWEKDKKKKEKAIANNYKIVYLWEREIKSMSDDEILVELLTRINEYDKL